jgi:hypothetical protein
LRNSFLRSTIIEKRLFKLHNHLEMALRAPWPLKNGSPKITTIEKWFFKSHNHWEIVLQMLQPLRNSSHVRSRRKVEAVKETTITSHCGKFKSPKQFMWNVESRRLIYNQVQENVQDSNVKKKNSTDLPIAQL